MTRAQSNRVTISRGMFNGRHVFFPELENLRPTSARVREAVFNILAPYETQDYGFLDACSGSGVMGFSAASCGFKPVIMLETNEEAMPSLERNKKRLDAQVTILKSNALAAKRLPLTGQHWICYADPPYTLKGFHTKLMKRLSKLESFSIGSFYVAEHETPLVDVEGFEEVKQRKYGRTLITIMEKTSQIALITTP